MLSIESLERGEEEVGRKDATSARGDGAHRQASCRTAS